jgi:hypothetical protein
MSSIIHERLLFKVRLETFIITTPDNIFAKLPGGEVFAGMAA